MNEIFKRVSVRKFLDKEVEEEKINNILRAAMQSPSAKNQQAWEFYVVRDKEKLLKLSNATQYSMCVKNAPMAIVICYREDCMEPDFIEIDCAIAAENIMLEAVSQGLGSVMIGVAPIVFNQMNVKNALKLEDNLYPFTIIPIGYPEKEKEQTDRFDMNKVHFV